MRWVAGSIPAHNAEVIRSKLNLQRSTLEPSIRSTSNSQPETFMEIREHGKRPSLATTSPRQSQGAKYFSFTVTDFLILGFFADVHGDLAAMKGNLSMAYFCWGIGLFFLTVAIARGIR